eukprot:NODE_5573_length_566_cov_62.580271_g4842_i0.p2 GENE.NODE_5573_length_566_cov_62.580271_g4842_i0~~NODE_5573_length_566_cov_62.580271_g4842_i0.p2  ORF type:complete len:122 (+),score=46.09 NODE_5573_length_566_cov_62.580271_g4842_i0:32-367(+)
MGRHIQHISGAKVTAQYAEELLPMLEYQGDEEDEEDEEGHEVCDQEEEEKPKYRFDSHDYPRLPGRTEHSNPQPLAIGKAKRSKPLAFTNQIGKPRRLADDHQVTAQPHSG